MANIKVAVRVRPISQREINVTGSDVVVHTGSREISLTNLKVSSSKAGDSRERTRRYMFDYCFDSSDQIAENYASQERLYSTLGESVIDTIFTGYNSCLVAYGQSASGKTYTMMGTKDDPGLIPRICNGIFARVAQRNEKSEEESFRISVSYLEVYNERVRDLLKPSTSSNGLRVREHPRLGPYVQGLTQHQVETLSSLMFRVEEGTKARKTASTLQNPTSSRSHALLTLTLEPFTSVSVPSASVQTSKSPTSSNVKRADFIHGCKLHLVDLAGSENAAACAGINRLKEGANINKSLVALGNVISALAERGNSGNNPGRRFIPYRDSALTWLLKDSLGGNATTIMLATISPASGSFNETSHTLRFAQRAQSVINRPVINEDPVAKIIRELRAEVARLQSLLLEKNIEPHTEFKPLACPCQHNQDRQDFETRCVSTSTSNSPTPDSVSSNVSLTRRHSSSDCITPKSDTTTPPKRFGSLEIIENINDTSHNLPLTNYNCAKISQLIEEEVHEPVFVDIPTLVAVLIKPDDTVQSNSHQIEEICSDGVPEDSIENVFACSVVPKAHNNLATQTIETVKHKINTNAIDYGPSFHIIENTVKSNTSQKPKLRKQQSTDSNLHGITSVLVASKRYGSTESLGKRSQPLAVSQKSQTPQTTVEKRVNSDKPKKLNNIKEIEDKSQRRDILTKHKPYLTRKPSIDTLKRRASKDSSSSSSKEEVVSISKERRNSCIDSEQLPLKPHTIIQRTRRADIVAAVTERLYSSRKTSEDSNTASTPASDIRSPENSEVKLASATRMRLQEISRKMLAKRRRICVDTQTDSTSTLRFKEKGINVREPKVLRKDASMLTDRHENYELLEPCDKVVRRVKEMSTSTTDAPNQPPVYFKDAANITDPCNDHWDSMELCQHDSGILYDDAHFDSPVEMTESSMNTNLPIEPPCTGAQTSAEDTRTCCNGKGHEKPAHPCQKEIKPCCPSLIKTPSGGSQSMIDEYSHDEHAHDHVHDHTDGHEHNHQHESTAIHEHKQHAHDRYHDRGHDHHDYHNHHSTPPVVKPCCPPQIHPPHKHSADDCDKSVISINLPDMINITIQSPIVLESKIQVYDGKDSRQYDTKRDTETQTDKKDALEIGTLTDENFIRPRMRDSSTITMTRPSGSQIDGRTFRIENIFQDPHCTIENGSTSIDVHPAGISSNCYQPNNSIHFTNSIGTSFTVGNRDNEKFYDSGLLSPVGRRRKSLTSEWFNKTSCTWPSTSRWRSQSPLGISKRQYNCTSIPTTDKYALASNYFYKHAVNTNFPTSHDFSWRRNNYNINMCNTVDEQRAVTKPAETKVMDKLPTLMCSSAGVTNEGLRSSSFIGMIDGWGVYEQETNFSDDSLDPKDEKVRRSTGDIKCNSIEKNKIEDNVNDNPCPPDVVAHTKKDCTDSLLCPEDTADFDDTNITLPRTKAGVLSADLPAPVQQFKSMILGLPLVPLLLNTEHDIADNGRVLLHKSSRDKKRVSFGEANIIIEPVTSPLCDYEFAESSGSIMKLNNPESIDKKITWKQSSQSNHPTRLSFPNRTGLDSGGKINKSTNIIEDYLDEALVFMRNINSINKYINIGNEANKKPQVRHLRETTKDLNRNPMTKKKEEPETSAYSPYEKCLRSMERLEQCLSRVKCHDDGVDGEYNVKTKESAEAKLDLAEFSQDSPKSAKSIDDLSIKYNNNYRVDRYFHRSVDDTDDDNESANFDLKTLDRYRKIIDTSRVKNTPKKRSRSLSSARVSDCDLDNANIYPKLMGKMNEDALIARVKKSLPSPRCTISKYDSSDENSSSDEALAAFIESIDKVSRSKDKFKYPASPRVKFLQLLSERRRIVENSRSTGAS